ncbi:MAG: sugar phosphate isomerase/epimerase [Planctomycetes bacterium]|nr:sugar phosphate isomerase/epimerase [Planctomycetota bacterium]
MNPRPNRRAVLAGLASAPLFMNLKAHSADSPMRGKLKKCCKIGMVGEGETLVEKFQLLKDVGFDGVEMDGPSGYDWKEVVDAKIEVGFEVPGVVCSTHWSKPLSDPKEGVRAEGVAGLETALRDARLYGASTVLLVPGVCNSNVSYKDAWERSTHELSAVLPLARELDVKIALENVWNDFITDAKEAARYVDQFKDDHLGWYFDVGNIVRYDDPVNWVTTLGERIIKLDIKDYSRAKMESEGIWKGFDCKIGAPESSAGWSEVMAALADIGYEGWGSAEVGGGGRDRLAEISKNMDDVFSR